MHLLATGTALLDEQSAAVDIAQPVADVLVLSFSDSDLNALGAAHAASGAAWRLGMVNLRALAHPMSVDLWLDRTARHAKLIVARVLGGLDWWRYGAESLAALARQKGIPLALLPGEDRDDPRLAALSTLPVAEGAALLALFRAGGATNAAGLVVGLGGLLAGDGAAIPPAQTLPMVGLYRRDGRGAAGHIALLLYRSQVMAGDVAAVDALIDGLVAADIAVTALYVPSLKAGGLTRDLAPYDDGTVDLVVTLTAFGGGADLPFGDAPLLHLAQATTMRDAWAAGDRGLGPADLAMHVVLPEIDGRVLAGAIAFKQASDATAVAGCRPELALLERAIARLRGWLRLRRTTRDGRRLALLLPDYPGAGGREAYAVGLDVPASLRHIITLLGDEGYDTCPLPATDRALLDAIIAGDTDARLPLAAYRQWQAAHPDAAAKMEAAWGPAEDDPTFRDGHFHFRATACGPHWLALPPERGRHDQRRADYHDVTLPPRHGLMAFCHWLQSQGLHALVHLGAHGTLEWLPGKAVALTPDCFPELAVDALPVLYPFIITNPGEAAQAKRRLGAVTPGHLPPPLAEGALTGPLAALERLVDEFAQADGVDPRRRNRLAALIVEEAQAQGLLTECGAPADADTDETLRHIDAWLCDIKDLALQDGLHIYGQAPPDAAPDIVASARGEALGLLTALDGRRLAPGPAGAPARGRRDVLPTGRNLFTSDPRTLPTQTAFDLGRRAADAVIRQHIQETGDMPRHLVLDLWGSAGLRTGGEEVAQALAFLGCKPLWEAATGRVRGVEILPPAVLDWPRVDVTLRVSGLFRDLFPAQIALLDSAIQAVAERDESDGDNPLAAARRAGDGMLRLFSCAPGRYGSGIDGMLADADTDDAELAAAYLEAAGFALKADGAMVPAPGAFARQVAAADLLVHSADDPHRDLLQGGADAAFIGGFALAAPDARLVVLDTTRPDKPQPRPLGAALARIVRGRAAHPRHVAALMRHGPRGGAEMAEAVDRLADFARATRAVDSHLFDLLFNAYLADTDVAAFLERENPDAGKAMAQRLDGLRQTGLWQCRRNDLSPLTRWLERESA
ncbi:cobaltochelatase subunit CobN [Niveispirillum irakense]|uniref:cobaltochelatase subunit CobN n=1 Tax=Niveispirillum irakense TaxID=34011 RepID=UPI000415C5B5|nr:cobaltochelatase subunit CobN [Niveispirillum irakense]